MLTESAFLTQEGLKEDALKIGFAGGRLTFPIGVINSYFATVLTDFLRLKLLGRAELYL